MFRKIQLMTFPSVVISVFFLTGCPPAAEYTQWQRPSTTEEGVKSAMTECGDPVGLSMNTLPENEQALQFLCMQHRGFTRKDGFDFCQVMADLPACVEKSRGIRLASPGSKRCPIMPMKGSTR